MANPACMNQTSMAPIKNHTPVEPKISTINDYDTKAKQDAEFIGKKEPEQKNTENKSTTEPQDDGWEITFEVRDKNVD